MSEQRPNEQRITVKWAMPNRSTFAIRPIAGGCMTSVDRPSDLEVLPTDSLLCRASGWLSAPEGESRASTVDLIRALMNEITRLSGVAKAEMQLREGNFETISKLQRVIKNLEKTIERYADAMEEDS